MLKANNVVALIGPTMPPAWKIDAVNGDQISGGGAGSLAAVAGYPHLTVPMGLVKGLPVGLSFIGPKWSEALLLSLGYAYEQARGPFPTPKFYRAIEDSPADRAAPRAAHAISLSGDRADDGEDQQHRTVLDGSWNHRMPTTPCRRRRSRPTPHKRCPSGSSRDASSSNAMLIATETRKASVHGKFLKPSTNRSEVVNRPRTPRRQSPTATA